MVPEIEESSQVLLSVISMSVLKRPPQKAQIVS